MPIACLLAAAPPDLDAPIHLVPHALARTLSVLHRSHGGGAGGASGAQHHLMCDSLTQQHLRCNPVEPSTLSYAIQYNAAPSHMIQQDPASSHLIMNHGAVGAERAAIPAICTHAATGAIQEVQAQGAGSGSRIPDPNFPRRLGGFGVGAGVGQHREMLVVESLDTRLLWLCAQGVEVLRTILRAIPLRTHPILSGL